MAGAWALLEEWSTLSIRVYEDLVLRFSFGLVA